MQLQQRLLTGHWNRGQEKRKSVCPSAPLAAGFHKAQCHSPAFCPMPLPSVPSAAKQPRRAQTSRVAGLGEKNLLQPPEREVTEQSERSPFIPFPAPLPVQLCRGRGLGAGQASGQLPGSKQLLGKNIGVLRALRVGREGKHLAGLPATPSQPGQTSWLWGGKSWEGPNPALGTVTGGLAAVPPEQNLALYGEKANSWP